MSDETTEIVEEIVEPVEQPPVDGEPSEPVEYTPDYNYSYKDEERAFDERLQASITDKESEDYVRDLYTRADGLESYKTKYDVRDGEYKALEQVSGNQTAALTQLQKFRDTGDYGSLMKALGLDEEKYLDHAEKIMDERDLPAEQQEALRQNRENSDKIAKLESQIQGFESTTTDHSIESDVRELETLMKAEAHSPVVKAMHDKGLNFMDEVVSMGHMEFVQGGKKKEPSVSSIVEKVSKKFSYMVPTTETNNLESEQLQVLPNIKGKPASAVAEPINSLDALKDLANQIPHSFKG